jgi:hypothetical protein
MSVTVAHVRQRVAAAVEAVTLPIALKESRWDLVAGTEPQNEAHGKFAVLALTTTFATPVESSRRTRPGGEGVVQTAIGVRWLFRIRPDGAGGYIADLDASYACEASIMAAITHHQSDGLRLSVLELRREIIGDGAWLRGEIVVRADHLLSI